MEGILFYGMGRLGDVYKRQSLDYDAMRGVDDSADRLF